jgi:hypothetical protein
MRETNSLPLQALLGPALPEGAGIGQGLRRVEVWRVRAGDLPPGGMGLHTGPGRCVVDRDVQLQAQNDIADVRLRQERAAKRAFPSSA